jgi:excisionase family DNA binding protein
MLRLSWGDAGMKHGLNSDSLALTYRQVARAANISERMVRKLVRAGNLTVVRIGRSARVPYTEVERLCGLTSADSRVDPQREPAK